MNKLQNVTIIIPCRNEEAFIGKCLDSIILQNYPKEMMEVLVVEGMSIDKTADVIKKYTDKYPFIRMLNNVHKFTSHAFNVGIKRAKGDIIILMGAHTYYEKDYVGKCVKYLNEYKADNVGGVMKTLPGKETAEAKAIAFSLSSRFGAGSYFRIGSNEPREVDTVFGGCYRKEIFDKIGLFNEKLIRSQDWEMNLRIKRSGGKIFLIPDIEIVYFPKSTLKDFFWHNFDDGFWVIYPAKYVNIHFGIRHYIPLIFAVSLMIFGFLWIAFDIYLPFLLFVFAYLSVALFFSLDVVLNEKKLIYIFLMPTTFFVRHLGFGLGLIWGIVMLILK